MSKTKIVLYSVATISMLGLFTLGGIYVNGFFNSVREEQRTRVLKESQAYTDGMRKQLNDLYLEYQKADATGRIGISNAVRDIFSAVDTTDYPEYLQTFLRQTGVR